MRTTLNHDQGKQELESSSIRSDMESGREAENFGSNKKSKADDGEETRQWQERPRAFKAQIVVGNQLRLEPRWNLTWIKDVLSLHLVSPQPWMESRWPFGVQTRGDRSEAALRGGPDHPARAQHDAYRRQVLEQS